LTKSRNIWGSIRPVNAATTVRRSSALVPVGVLALAIVGAAWSTTRLATLALLVLLALVAIHEAGHLLAAKAVGVGAPEFSIGFGPILWATKTRPGRTRFALRAVPLGGFVKIAGLANGRLERGAAEDDSVKCLADVDAPRRILVAAAGPLANVLVSMVCLFAVFAFIGVSTDTNRLGAVQPDSPAAAAGLHAGDVIESINSVPVGGWDELRSIVTGLVPGTRVTLSVRRDGQRLSLAIVPDQADDGTTRLGVSTSEGSNRLDPIAAVSRSATGTVGLLRQTVGSLGSVASAAKATPSHIVHPSAAVPTGETRLVSPIGAARMAEQAGRKYGPAGPLVVIASVSMFLAIFNLLPVPPLDGGHVVVAAVEGIVGRVRRRRLRFDTSRLAPLAATVVVGMAALGLMSMVLDVVHPALLP
jgi:regulator of sigma E protease